MHIFKGQQINIYCLRCCSSVNQDLMVQESATMNCSQERHPTLQCRMGDGHEMHIHMQQARRIKCIFIYFSILLYTHVLYEHLEASSLAWKATRCTNRKYSLCKFEWENKTQNRLSPASGLQCYFGCQEYTAFPLKGKSNQFPWGWRHPTTRWGYSVRAYAFSERMSSFTLNPCQTTRTGW